MKNWHQFVKLTRSDLDWSALLLCVCFTSPRSKLSKHMHRVRAKLYSCTGGRIVNKTVRFDLEAIRGTAPNVVVLEMGSNDACEKDSDAETIASSLVALTELLISECKLQFIVVCHILPRKHRPFEEYNDRASPD